MIWIIWYLFFFYFIYLFIFVLFDLNFIILRYKELNIAYTNIILFYYIAWFE